MSGREYEDGAFYWVRQFQSDDEAGPWTIGRWDEWGWTVLGDRVGFSVVEVGPCLGKEPPADEPEDVELVDLRSPDERPIGIILSTGRLVTLRAKPPTPRS